MIENMLHNIVKDEDRSERVVFVIPASDALPDDGFLHYQQVVSVYDYKDLKPYTVAVVAEADIAALKCVADNAALFDIHFRYLAGAPNRVYSVKFDDALWSAERLSYTAMVADVRVAEEARKAVEAERRSAPEVERARVTRANGAVKDFTKVEMKTASPVEEVDESGTLEFTL